ncbi:hypothetical protein DFP72DRAFT_844061 [Ephemerocybe angulata]|uniref:Uncharacterized protein n=1 Tax=Ephemerocybe angulata TaxID=980116 RepID=A0A8H6I6R3_9AGAR|nr:hypothetical protein DFP72DRAFT_844061 [Tulosesus angulatus]
MQREAEAPYDNLTRARLDRIIPVIPQKRLNLLLCGVRVEQMYKHLSKGGTGANIQAVCRLRAICLIRLRHGGRLAPEVARVERAPIRAGKNGPKENNGRSRNNCRIQTPPSSRTWKSDLPPANAELLRRVIYTRDIPRWPVVQGLCHDVFDGEAGVRMSESASESESVKRCTTRGLYAVEKIEFHREQTSTLRQPYPSILNHRSYSGHSLLRRQAEDRHGEGIQIQFRTSGRRDRCNRDTPLTLGH